MSSVALAVVAHPDDIEFVCAGVLLRLRLEQGWTIHLATMTPGDCGSALHPPAEIAAIRRAEAAAAAAIIGGPYHCLEERDLRVVYSPGAVEKVVHLINATGAHLIFTHSPEDYHLDHEQTSTIVRAAAFAAPIPNFLHGRHRHPPLPAVPHLYYCDPIDGCDAFGRPIPPDIRINIACVMAAKAAALGCHDSQRAWLKSHQGVDHFIDTMTARAAAVGAAAGLAFAEGFRQHRGHGYPPDDLLTALLGTSSGSPP